jgi:hypothetical protein
MFDCLESNLSRPRDLEVTEGQPGSHAVVQYDIHPINMQQSSVFFWGGGNMRFLI